MTVSQYYTESAGSNRVRLVIIVPLYKHSGLVWEALATSLHQKDTSDFAIVLINDGCPLSSTHATGLAFANINSTIPIRYFRQKNKGLSGARNTGVKIALQEFPDLEALYFLDADNRLSDVSVRNMLKALDQYPAVDWFYPDIQTFGLNEHYSMDGQYRPSIHTELNICEAGSLVRRKVFDAGIRFDEGMKNGYEDWEFWLSALKAGFQKPMHLRDIEYRYRKRPESMLAASHREDIAIRSYILKKHPWLRNPGELDPPLTGLDDPNAPLAIITPEGGAYFEAPTSEYETLPIERIRDDFWRWCLKPNTYGFPRHILFTDPETLALLETLKLLPWTIWDLQSRLIDTADIASLQIVAEPEKRFVLEDPIKTTLNETSIRSAMSMVETASLSKLVLDKIHKADVSTLQRGDDMRHDIRKIQIPLDEVQTELDQQDSLQQMLSTALLFVDRNLSQEVMQWQVYQSGIPVRNGHTRPFMNDGFALQAQFKLPKSKNKQIAFTTPFADFGGVERVAYQLGRILKENGFDCHLISLSESDIKTPPEFREAFSSINWFSSKHLLRWSKGPFMGTFLPDKLPHQEEKRLTNFLSNFDIVINCQSPDIRNIVGQLKEAGIYCIDHHHIVERTRAGQPVGHPFQGLAFEHGFDLFLTCSNQLREWFVSNGVPKEKVLTVPNGPGLMISGKGDQIAKQKEGHETESKTSRPLRAVFLGRLEYQKGIDRLVELIAETHNTVDWRVIGKAIVGDDMSAGLEALSINVEEPLYESKDIQAVFDWADIMVLPSRFEGLPLVIIDAMSCGVPVVSTNVGAISEIIEHEKTGFLLEENDFVSQAGDILSSFDANNKLLQNIARNALEAARNFSWEERSKKFVDLLNSNTKL